MKVSNFKNMKKAVVEAIETSDNNNPIWYARYLWITLTKRQAKEIVEILRKEVADMNETVFDMWVRSCQNAGIDLVQLEHFENLHMYEMIARINGGKESGWHDSRNVMFAVWEGVDRWQVFRDYRVALGHYEHLKKEAEGVTI